MSETESQDWYRPDEDPHESPDPILRLVGPVYADTPELLKKWADKQMRKSQWEAMGWRIRMKDELNFEPIDSGSGTVFRWRRMLYKR